MKKKLAVAAVLAGLGAGAWVAHAANTSGTFNVNITLTSGCTLSSVTAVDFAYTAFQAGTANATNGNFSVTCTGNLPYSIGLQQGNGAVSPPGTATIGPITDNAVNLDYSLGLSGAAVGTGATGSGNAQNYNVTGTIASGQAGSCTPGAASCSNTGATNKTHTLIVNY